MSFFVKAAVHALKKYPVVNASIDGTDIVYHGYFDIGVAVGSPRGWWCGGAQRRPDDLRADREADRRVRQEGAGRQARARGLSGGTFSISNGGVFGSMLSTPIINPPQSAILGVHATKDRPVVENGQVVIRPINYLALSYDHRIIDGREAVAVPRVDQGGARGSVAPAPGPVRGGHGERTVRRRRDRGRPGRLHRGDPRGAARPEGRLREKWTNPKGELALGGTCLNVGCIPSKALLASSEKFEEALHHLDEHGIEVGAAKLDLAKMLARKDAS